MIVLTRRAERPFYCPPAFDATTHALRIKPARSGRFTKRSIPISWNHLRAAVVALLFRCGPSAVIRNVTACVVDSVYGVLRCWFSAHVKQERHKRFAPAITDRHSARTVFEITRLVRVVTTTLHGCPCSILWRFSFAMRAVALARFTRDASTRRRGATSKMGATNCLNSSAVATAQPHSVSTVSGSLNAIGLLNHNEPSESEPSHVHSNTAHSFMILQYGDPITETA